jgi:hypothetical protein
MVSSIIVLLSLCGAAQADAGTTAPPAMTDQQAEDIELQWRLDVWDARENHWGNDFARALQEAKERFAEKHDLTVAELDAIVESVEARHEAAREEAQRKKRRENWFLAGLFVLNAPLYWVLAYVFFGGWAGFFDELGSSGRYSPPDPDISHGWTGADRKSVWLKLIVVLFISLWTVLWEFRALKSWGL